MKILLIALISLNLYAASFHTTKYNISFHGYLITDLDDNDHAIKRQINHSQGPMLNLRIPGTRSTLSHFYKYEVTKVERLNDNLKKVFYTYNGELLAEENVDLNSLKIVVPVQAKAAYKIAMNSRGRCGANNDLGSFFHYWSPYYKNCKLKKGIDFEEFSINSYDKVVQDTVHLADELLVNGEYNLFYYYGSDFFSLSKFGYAKDAYNQTIRLFKKNGFIDNYNSSETQAIFNSTRLYSNYKKMKGSLNGKPTNVYILLGNPTDATPGAKYEFFRFLKFGLLNASTIQYSGHAGLGSVFNLDALEEQYKEKIEYNQNQKQIIYIDGCNTYFYSKNFFFKKKSVNNSLIFISNGETITTNYFEQSVNVLFKMLIKGHFMNSDIEESSYYYMRRAKLNDYQMLDVSNN